MELYIHLNGQTEGPFSEEQVIAKIENGSLAESDLAMVPGQTDWHPVSSFIVREEEAEVPVSDTTPAPPDSQTVPAAPESRNVRKSKIEKIASRVLVGILGMVMVGLFAGVIYNNFLDASSRHTFMQTFVPQTWRDGAGGIDNPSIKGRPIPFTLQMQQALAEKVSNKMDRALRGALDQIATQDMRVKKEPTGVSSVDQIRILKESVEELGYGFEATLLEISRSRKELDGSLFVTELLSPVQEHRDEAFKAGLISQTAFGALSAPR